eukprot:7548649-Alexandrium_andersonii.AAC.1
MASWSVDGSTSTAVLRPSRAAYRPHTVGADAAPKTRTRKNSDDRELVLVLGQGRLMERVGDV